VEWDGDGSAQKYLSSEGGISAAFMDVFAASLSCLVTDFEVSFATEALRVRGLGGILYVVVRLERAHSRFGIEGEIIDIGLSNGQHTPRTITWRLLC